jgi:hypothetical protein
MKLLAVCLVVFAWVSAFSLDRGAFTFTKYDLDVQVEPELQRLGVRGTITLRNDSATAQKNVALQISSSLTWRSIQADGKPLQFVSQGYTSDIDHTGELSEAIVSLPSEVAPGSAVELKVGYEGVIALDATRLTRIGMSKESALHTDWDQISRASSAVRGAGNVVWYPVSVDAANLSDENSLFDMLGRWKTRELNAEMRIRISNGSPEGTKSSTLVCNGKDSPITATTSIGGALSTDCSLLAAGSNSPTFAIADYEILNRPTLLIAYRPEHKSNAEKFAQAAEVVTPFVMDWFGKPREQIRIAELFDPGASPYESGPLLLTPLADTDPKLLQIAMVHEFTHSAFVSNRPWIYEGLAHFAQAAYRESQQNREAALDFLSLHRAAMVAAQNAIAARPRDQPGNDESLVGTTIDEFYRSKAAYVWWMLRDMLGDDVLKKALANYRADQDKEPAYLQHLLETESKRNLQWFFDDWVYHDRGLPDFRLESAFPRQASQNNYLITVTVENLGAAGAEVPVTIHFDGAEITERVEVRGKAKAVVRVATPKRPTQVTVNDGSVPESDMRNNEFKVGPVAQ